MEYSNRWWNKPSRLHCTRGDSVDRSQFLIFPTTNRLKRSENHPRVINSPDNGRDDELSIRPLRRRLGVFPGRFPMCGGACKKIWRRVWTFIPVGFMDAHHLGRTPIMPIIYGCNNNNIMSFFLCTHKIEMCFCRFFQYQWTRYHILVVVLYFPFIRTNYVTILILWHILYMFVSIKKL